MGAVEGKDDKDHILVPKVTQVSTSIDDKVTKGASVPLEETAQTGKVQEIRTHQVHVLCTEVSTNCLGNY